MHTEDDEGKMLGVKRVGKKEVGEDIHIYLHTRNDTEAQRHLE